MDAKGGRKKGKKEKDVGERVVVAESVAKSWRKRGETNCASAFVKPLRSPRQIPRYLVGMHQTPPASQATIVESSIFVR